MINHLKDLRELIASESSSVIIITLFIALIPHLKAIALHLAQSKIIRINKLESAIKSDLIHGITKDHLIQEYEKACYKQALGIGLERGSREKLIKLFESANGAIQFNHFKRSISNMDFDKDQIEISTPYISWFGLTYGILATALLIAITYKLPSLLIDNLELLSLEIYFGIAVIIFSFTVVIVSTLKDAITIISIRHVRNHIRDLKSKHRISERTTKHGFAKFSKRSRNVKAQRNDEAVRPAE